MTLTVRLGEVVCPGYRDENGPQGLVGHKVMDSECPRGLWRWPGSPVRCTDEGTEVRGLK